MCGSPTLPSAAASTTQRNESLAPLGVSVSPPTIPSSAWGTSKQGTCRSGGCFLITRNVIQCLHGIYTGTGHLAFFGYLCRSFKCWMTDFLLKRAAYMFALVKAITVPGADMRKQPSPLMSRRHLQKRRSGEGCRTVTRLPLKICHMTPSPLISFQCREKDGCFYSIGGEKTTNLCLFATNFHSKKNSNFPPFSFLLGHSPITIPSFSC